MSESVAGAAVGVKWDLSNLFSSPDDPQIAATWEVVRVKSEKFAEKYRGQVASLDAPGLAQAIQELESITQDASKPAAYASLLFASDVSEPRHGALYQEQMEKGSEIRVKLMFFGLELQRLDEDRAKELLEAPELLSYRHYITNVRAYSAYMLSEAEEVLLEETANVGSRAWERLHEEVTSNIAFRWTDPSDGKVYDLTEGEVLEKMRHPDRAVRKNAAEGLTEGLTRFEKVLAYTYNTLLADKKLEDRLRQLPYPETSRHLANELDKETVDLVMQLTKERSGTVARYYKVKQQILGVETMTEYDRYAPLFESKELIGFPAAKQIVLDSFKEFSPLMSAKAEEFFDHHWIDAEPRKGKRGGAFCSYVTPDTHPFVLMTYLGSLEDVDTLAHELGHGVHASLSRCQSEFNFHGTLPLAELASIFGEMLVFDKLVEQVSDKEKLALYATKIEGIFASVHRQSAMFRFEQRCHNWRREKGELSPSEFSDIWQDEIQSMFLDSVALSSDHRVWWSYVGHFIFAPFYVYAYAFGNLLTLAIYQMSKQEGPSFAAKYEEVLKLGGSQTPHELMARLGVDLRSREFWLGGFAAIEEMVEAFEALWAKSA